MTVKTIDDLIEEHRVAGEPAVITDSLAIFPDTYFAVWSEYARKQLAANAASLGVAS